MAKKMATTQATGIQAQGTPTLRRCIGSKRYGIEPHEALVEDFPAQPSQKDGLGRMCRSHWNQYTAGLARDAKARKAAADGGTKRSEATTDVVPAEPETAAPFPKRPKRAKTLAPVPGAQGDAG